MKSYTVEQVQAHNTPNDCWIIIDGKVFDVTAFLNEHPGGKKVLAKKAGKDCSKVFKQFHNDSIMQRVGLPMQIGVIGSAQAAPEEKPAAAAPKATTAASTTPAVASQGLADNQVAKFGEGIPYADPSWYQEMNRYSALYRLCVINHWLTFHCLVLTTTNPIFEFATLFVNGWIKRSAPSVMNGARIRKFPDLYWRELLKLVSSQLYLVLPLTPRWLICCLTDCPGVSHRLNLTFSMNSFALMNWLDVALAVLFGPWKVVLPL